MLYGCTKEKISGFTSTAGTSWASTCATFVKCSLRASATSPEVLIVLLSTWISKILDDLLVLRELNSLMGFHVLLGLPLLASKLSEKSVSLRS